MAKNLVNESKSPMNLNLIAENLLIVAENFVKKNKKKSATGLSLSNAAQKSCADRRTFTSLLSQLGEAQLYKILLFEAGTNKLS